MSSVGKLGWQFPLIISGNERTSKSAIINYRCIEIDKIAHPVSAVIEAAGNPQGQHSPIFNYL